MTRKKETKKKAKNFFIGIASFLGGAGAALAAASGWSKSNYSSTGLPDGSIYNIISNVVMWALGIFGFIAIVGFVISGIMYLTSSGDDTAMKKAKSAMYYSLTGVIVGLVGIVIIYAIDTMLRGVSPGF